MKHGTRFCIPALSFLFLSILNGCMVSGSTPPLGKLSLLFFTDLGAMHAEQQVIPVSFDVDMDKKASLTLVTEDWNASAYVNLPNTGTTFTWVNARTLNIALSWVRYPENSQIRWTLSGLKTAAGAAAANKTDTVSTSSRNTYFPVADTGQTGCYNPSVLTTCSVAGYEGQDGDYSGTPRARSFSGPSAVNGDYRTTDNVTGLIWKSCSEGQSGASCGGGSAAAFNWYNAVNACASLNMTNSGAGYSGHTNWRLPSRAELESLPDYGRASGATIDTGAFPGTAIDAYYWTSSSYIAKDAVWGVYFYTGTTSYLLKSTAIYHVRCVASP